MEWNRRELLTGLSSVSTLAMVRPAWTQSTDRLNALRELVASQRLRTELYMRINIVRGVLVTNIFRNNPEFTRYEDFSKLPESENWQKQQNELTGWLHAFYNGEVSAELLAALDQSNVNELIEEVVKNTEPLIGNVAKALEEEGIQVDSPPGEALVDSVRTVDELNALQRNMAAAQSYLCEHFPFSAFCSV